MERVGSSLPDPETFDVIDPPGRGETIRAGGRGPHDQEGVPDAPWLQPWSNARILGAACKLTDEQLAAPGAFPHGGLRGTLVHALFAEWTWRMRWLGTPPPFGYRLKLEEYPAVAALRHGG